MQEATDLSVEAIDKIQKKISEVEHISTIIAAAVHEQGAATQEIARNVPLRRSRDGYDVEPYRERRPFGRRDQHQRRLCLDVGP